MIDRNEAFARDLLAANIAAGNDIKTYKVVQQTQAS